MSGWPAAASLAVERFLSAIALDVHLEDRGVNAAVDGGERHRLIGKNPSPFAKWLIGRDERRASLVARCDQFEQDAGFGLILGDVGDVVEDELALTRAADLERRYKATIERIVGPEGYFFPVTDAPGFCGQGQVGRSSQLASPGLSASLKRRGSVAEHWII